MEGVSHGSREASGNGKPLAREVYNALLSKLISPDIKPGSKITIDTLARELAVSPTPVREALGRLEMNGLVVRSHNAGYRVAPKMTRSQFENLVEIRLALEPVVSRKAAQCMGRKEIAELQDLADQMSNSEMSDGQTYVKFAQDDHDFHDAIAVGSGNELIRDALERLYIHVRLFRLSHADNTRIEALNEHQAILDAIRRGDPEEASYEMRRHIIRSAERYRLAFDDSSERQDTLELLSENKIVSDAGVTVSKSTT